MNGSVLRKVLRSSELKPSLTSSSARGAVSALEVLVGTLIGFLLLLAFILLRERGLYRGMSFDWWLATCGYGLWLWSIMEASRGG